MKIGILTGGGDCPGLNAVIRAAVKTAISKFGWTVIGAEDSYDGFIFPGKLRRLTLDDVRGILPRGGTILGTSNRGDPFQYPVEKDGVKKYENFSGKVIEKINELGLDGIIAIGGDGTLRISQRFVDMGVQIVGVPKTIDNDLSETDITFGFNTACQTATEALDKVHTTAASHDRVMIVEVMGRYAGWIAIEAGIAGGADVILIPEIPYDIEKICGKIMSRKENGASFSIVVAAEGAQPIGGRYTFLEESRGPLEPRLGGVGEKLAKEIEPKVGLEARVVVLGHLQRGGSPMTFDRLISTRFGVHAVNLLAEGKTGMMVALKGTEVTEVPIKSAIARMKKVPPDGNLVLCAEALGISFGR